MAAILRYNNSMPYAQNVLGWAAAYATGVVPVDLPPITGPPPPLGNAHDEHPEGLGPGLPMNINGLSINDPMARMPLIDLSGPQPAGAPPMFPWMAPATPPSAQGRGPGCTLICIGSQSPPPLTPPRHGRHSLWRPRHGHRRPPAATGARPPPPPDPPLPRRCLGHQARRRGHPRPRRRPSPPTRLR